MPPKTGKRNHVNKNNIPVITKDKLFELVKKKTEMASAEANLIYDRTKQLPNQSDGCRFLIMKKKKVNDVDDDSMKKVNPVMIARLLRGVGEIESMRIIHDGGLLIKTTNYKTANKIFQIARVPGHEVDVQEYTKLNKSVGVIFDRSLAYASDDDILDELKKWNIKSIKRVEKTNAQGEKYSTGTFFLTFNTVNLPASVTVGYMNHKLTPYVPNPTRCFKCQQYGHVSASCKSDVEICVQCGDEKHTTPTEKCEKPMKCANCSSSDHNSMSRDCPVFAYRKKIEEIRVNERKSFYEAKDLLDKRDPRANPAAKRKPTFSAMMMQPSHTKRPSTSMSMPTELTRQKARKTSIEDDNFSCTF